MFCTRILLTVLACALASFAVAAPSVTVTSPTPSSTVGALTTVSITFSETVTGVEPQDLEINGQSAAAVSGSGAGPYVFSFTQPEPGTVAVTWDFDHGISGIATGAFVPTGSWSYTLTDSIAPTIGKIRTSVSGQELDAREPQNGATVAVLSQAVVNFSEFVSGVDAGDLRVNGVPASAVTGAAAGPYVFTFPQPAAGAVSFTWAASPGIVDGSGNAFVPSGTWAVTLAATTGAVGITEFLAANALGITDEDLSQEDWIEIRNTGATSVNLVGWSLTDDAELPAKWVFPNRTIAAGGFITVFASGKDRKPAAGNLHTNFKLNENGGYLALYSPDSPQTLVASSPGIFPPQRYDYSYGIQSTGGLRYFATPTPGVANGTSALTTVAPKPHASVSRGFFKDPISVILTCTDPTATVRYTLNGTIPNASSPAYSAPISINATSVIRAASFSATTVPSDTVTHSYVYLDNVFSQASPPYILPNNPPSFGGAAFPTTWGTNTTFTTATVPLAGYVNNDIPADYGMDDKVWNDPNLYDDAGNISPSGKTNLQRMKESLRTLPILSVVLPTKDMFGPLADVPTALYPNSTSTNKTDRTKPCSLELILPDSTTAFATTCGIDIHGNASRDPFKNPKHGFTLKFKGDYGPGTLDYPLFPDSPVKEFDKLVLRADFNSSWLHQDGGTQRPKGTRIRDAWSKDTFRAMGRAAGHHRYTNLFINGVYWGTYDLAEDEAEDFAASYFGGKKEDYDAIDQGTLKSGTFTAYYAMKAILGWTGATYTTAPSTTVLATAFTNTEYENLKQYLDIQWFCDYMIQHYYVGHEDWGTTTDYNKNWYVVRDNKPGGKFRLLPWDQENLLWSETVNRVTGALYPPFAAQNRLRTNAQFALDFADRVHKHMVAPDGALLPAANIARLNKWAAVMNAGAMALESARWGDYRMNVHQYQNAPFNIVYTWNGKWYSGGSTQTSTTNWLAEITRLNGTYFPVRTANVLAQFRATATAPILQLYPTLNAPELRNNATNALVSSGRVNAGTVVKLVLLSPIPSGTTSAGTIYYTLDGSDPRVAYTGGLSPAATAYTGPITVNNSMVIKARCLNGTAPTIAANAWSALNETTLTVGSQIPSIRITELHYNPPGSQGGDASEFVEVQNIGTFGVDVGGWSFGGLDFVFPTGTIINAGDRVVIASNNAPATFAAQFPGVSVFGYFGGSMDNGGERVTLYDAALHAVTSVEYDDVFPWPTQPDGGGYSLEIINPSGDQGSPANWKASNTIKGTPGTANSTTAVSPVIISEFFVNNAGAYTVSGASPSFVELQNTSGASVDVSGWNLTISSGVTNASIQLPVASTIAPGGTLLVHISNTAVPGITLAATMNTAAGFIRLGNAANALIDGVRYGPQAANYSFSKIGGVWSLSSPTPGAAAIATGATLTDVRINEIFANPSPGDSDWLELTNIHATLPVSLIGLNVGANGELFRITAPAAIAPGGYTQFFCKSGGKDGNELAFDLPAAGTTITLSTDTGTALNSLAYTAQTEGISQGRLPNGTGALTTLPYPSPAIANYAALSSQPVLNEILVNNRNGDNAPWGARPGWFELKNPGAGSIDLSGWRLRPGGSAANSWAFPAGVSIPAGGYLAVWSDAQRAASTTNALHLNCQLGNPGGLELVNPQGQIADRIVWGKQLTDLSIGRLADNSWALLAQPTRAAQNSTAATLGAQSAIKLNEWGSMLELYNTAALPVSLAGLYLTDDPSEIGRRKYRIPALSYIGANDFAVFIADGGAPDAIRTGFAIDMTGESLRLGATDDTQLDTASFGIVAISRGRTPDGTGSAAALNASSFGYANVPSGAGPWFTGGNGGGTVLAGTSAAFSASFFDATSFQWSRNGTPISGATVAAYTIPTVTSGDDGSYTCAATGPGGTRTSPAFTLTVLHTFETWCAENGMPGALPDADADGDGTKNLAEFIANTSPLQPATAAERTAAHAFGSLELSGGTPITQIIEFRLNRRAAFTSIFGELSSDLSAWTSPAPAATELLGTQPNGDQNWRLKFTIPNGTGKQFLRLNITK